MHAMTDGAFNYHERMRVYNFDGRQKNRGTSFEIAVTTPDRPRNKQQKKGITNHPALVKYKKKRRDAAAAHQ